MTPAIPISEALADRNLLGAALGDIGSWRTWLAILKAAFAEPLTDEERALFALVAGDRAPPSRRVRELWAGPIGRRSGKSRMAAAVAVSHCGADRSRARWRRVRSALWRSSQPSRDQADTVFNYVRGFLMASPLLAGQVESIGRDEIMLRGDICISVVTNSFRVARGMTLLAVHWRRGFVTGGTKARRSLTSRPIARCCRRWWRRAACLLASAPAIVVPGCCSRSTAIISVATVTTCCASAGRPRFSTRRSTVALIAKAREQDPESAEAEWDGGFRRDIAAFLSDHDIDAAVDHDRPMELAPRSGLRYRALC